MNDEAKKKQLREISLLEKKAEQARLIGDPAARNRFEQRARALRQGLEKISSSITGQDDDNFNDESTFGEPIDTGEEVDEQGQSAVDRIPKESSEEASGQSPVEKASATPAPPPKSPKEAAKPEPVGGPALRPAKKPTPGKARQAISEGANQAVSKAADLAKQAVKQAAKAAARNLIAAFTGATWWIWLIVAVVIIILFVIGLAYMSTVSNTKKPSVYGGTPVIQADPKKNGAAITNLLKLAGEQSITSQDLNNSLDKIKTDLTKIKDDATAQNDPDKDAIIKKVDLALSSLEVLRANKSLEGAQGFLAKVGDVYDVLEDKFPAFTVDATHPVRMPSDEAIATLNADLHGNSFLNTEASESNNVYFRDTSGKEKCDAVDISVTQGSSIYPVFGGTVVDVSSDGDSDGKKVLIKSGNYTALYAHLKNPTKIAQDPKNNAPLKNGDSISIAEAIGMAKTNNIHIEMIYTNPDTNAVTCLITTHADMLDHASKNRRHQDWGSYLWDRLLKKFSLKK